MRGFWIKSHDDLFIRGEKIRKKNSKEKFKMAEPCNVHDIFFQLPNQTTFSKWTFLWQNSYGKFSDESSTNFFSWFNSFQS